MRSWKELTDSAQLAASMAAKDAHLYLHDRLQDLGFAQAKQVTGRPGYTVWTVWAPTIQHIDVEHLYPQHGQFADWEIGVNHPFPAYVQLAHP